MAVSRDHSERHVWITALLDQPRAVRVVAPAQRHVHPDNLGADRAKVDQPGVASPHREEIPQQCCGKTAAGELCERLGDGWHYCMLEGERVTRSIRAIGI